MQLDPVASKLPEEYQVTALMSILCGPLKQHFDLKYSAPGSKEPTVKDLREEFGRYCSIGRAEAKLRNAMDLDNVEGDRPGNNPGGASPPPPGTGTPSGWCPQRPWYGGWSYQETPTGPENWGGKADEGSVNQLGKGKEGK